jgi:hypothetical protein
MSKWSWKRNAEDVPAFAAVSPKGAVKRPALGDISNRTEVSHSL